MDEKFFGPADERVVTRDQMNKFASELFTTLNVEEDYEIKEEQFSKYALDTIISSVWHFILFISIINVTLLIGFSICDL